MKSVVGIAVLGATLVAPAAHARETALFPFCKAERLYVVYEASEGFALYGAAERNDSIQTTIHCYIRRFGTTVVASTAQTTPGPASATASVVGTPYGGMEVCMQASYVLVNGFVSVGPSCSRIPAPS